MHRIFPGWECQWRDFSEDDAVLAIVIGRESVNSLWYDARHMANHPRWNSDELMFYSRAIAEVARQKAEYEVAKILESEGTE